MTTQTQSHHPQSALLDDNARGAAAMRCFRSEIW
jgi:hypothetical protein